MNGEAMIAPPMNAVLMYRLRPSVGWVKLSCKWRFVTGAWTQL